jgi:hypothetical protein
MFTKFKQTIKQTKQKHEMPPDTKKYPIAGTKIYVNIPLGA